MSVTYHLFRLKGPPAARPLHVAAFTEASILPFGPLDAIAARLVEALEKDGPVTRTDHPELLHVELRFSSGSRDLEATLWDNPLQSISINRASPHDFLPIVDALAELGPFVIFCDSHEELLDPEDYRPRQPDHVEKALLLLPFLEGRPGGLLEPVWQVEGPVYLYDNPFRSGPSFLCASFHEKLTALDARTGTTLWTVSFRGRGMHAAPAGDVIVCAGQHPRCFGLSSRTGKVLWQFDLDGEAHAPGTPLPDGSMALPVHTRDDMGDVLVIDPATGARLWRTRHREAHTMSLAAAGDYVLAGAGDGVYCQEREDGRLHGSFSAWDGGAHGGAPLMAAVESTGIFLTWNRMFTRDLPSLDAEVEIRSFPEVSGFERFLVKLTDSIVVAGIPSGEDGGFLCVFEGPGLRLLHEIPIAATPSEPVLVTPDLWACLLRPLRQNHPRRPQRPEREAEVILVDLRTGRIVHREPLGPRGWYPGHVTGGDGWLHATVQSRSRGASVSGIRTFRTKLMAPNSEF